MRRRSTAASTVLVTGGTGSTGRAVVDELVAKGYRVRCVVRSVERASKPTSLGKYTNGDAPSVELVKGDITDAGSIRDAMVAEPRPSFVVLAHGPSKACPPDVADVQGMRYIVSAAEAAGSVRTIIHMSTWGTTRPYFPVISLVNALEGGTIKGKMQAESVLRQSGLSYVIVRAGILGQPGGSQGEKGDVKLLQGDRNTGMVSRASVAMAISNALVHAEARMVGAGAGDGKLELTFEVYNGDSSRSADDVDFAGFFDGASPDSAGDMPTAQADVDALAAKHDRGVLGLKVLAFAAAAGLIALGVHLATHS